MMTTSKVKIPVPVWIESKTKIQKKMDPLLTEIEPSVAQEDEEHSGGYYRFIYCLLLFTK